MNKFIKFKFLFQKNPVIVITGEGRLVTSEMISCVLKEKNVLIFETDDKDIKKYEFFLKNSPLPILVITHLGDIPFDRDYFAGTREKIVNTLELAKTLGPQTKLVLNYDDETSREVDDFTNLHAFTFGFSERADFWVSNLNFNRGMNFKINHKGSLVPFWLENTYGKEQIYGALATAVVGTLLDLNLVEISQRLKDYQPLPGKMRLIEGINESFILDDAESATVFSMIEAVEILGKISDFRRKIAILGDLIGSEDYIIEAHERVGEVVAKNAHLLFTFGKKARFIARGAMEKGMSSQQIFSFDSLEEGIEKIKKTIRAGDLVLVDGSKEMRMSEIVDQIRKIW